MDVRLAVALARRVDEDLEVAAFCRALGISRERFYVYEQRYREEGLTGLVPRSRAPHHHPNQTPEVMADRIVAWRTKLAEQGLDNGARSIWAWMKRAGEDPPHPRTVHRVLVRRGLVTPQPKKRPRSSYRRFAATAPNGIWQLDGTEWPLADGTPQVILQVLDDHSRQVLASLVVHAETGTAAWTVLHQAMARHGMPAMFLSDNSMAFNGSRRNAQVMVERNLRALGVAVVAASQRHPQTCGKAERQHQTLLKWLRSHPAAESAVELQRLVDMFDVIYNQQRPHQASPNGTGTPAELYDATAKATPATGPLPAKPRISEVKVSSRGEVPVGPLRVQVGRGWEGARVTVIRDGNSVAIFHRGHLVDQRIIDPNRRYQPSGKKSPGAGKRLPRPPGVLSAMS